ncbi:WYL domain-containing protein [Cohnella xylanilytica]|uniref:WYL domain-containing protein n=1 Tax=Cohnella xylanilytica TaxID=557555 RepID=UPI001BB45639|nr:WYL domain-containing protein [Cohnella xylanilytica]
MVIDVALNEDGTGYLDRTMSESYVDWVASYMLSLGEDARVIQPRQVVDRIRETVRQLSNLYKKEADEWLDPPKS